MRRLPLLLLSLLCATSLTAGCAGCLGPDASKGEGFREDLDGVLLRDGGHDDDASGGADAESADDAEVDAGDDAAGSGDAASSSDDSGGDGGGDGGADPSGDAGDAGDAADEPDLPAPAVCGDGVVEGNEVCDDGNLDDGDYCSGDCLVSHGSCGDGVLQSFEACDDATTADCIGTHDGGDGRCVPAGTCSSGYAADPSGTCVANTTGLTVPCSNGPGWTLFAFHWGTSGGTSPSIDVWDASCSYSLASNSACNVYAICPGFCDPSYTANNFAVVLTSSNYLRVRFSVAGLNFTQATLYLQARSYATSSSTYFDVWSPIYGGLSGLGPVDNDFTYDWYAVDWSSFLAPTDDPDLTAIQIYGGGGSGQLATHAVEMCVQ